MRKLVLLSIRFYQKYLNFNGFLFRFLFLTDRSCRFAPTCSQYAAEAVGKHGIGSGLWLSLKRVLKCHPWSRGGYDPVP